MRPTRRLLWAALIALGLTALLLPFAAGDGSLLAVPWMGLAALIILDLVGSVHRRRHLELEGPETVFAGETARFRLHIDPAAPPGLIALFDWPEGVDGPAEARPVQGDDVIELPLTGRARGAWALGRVWLNWPSRFGFFDFTPSTEIGRSVTILPDIRPVTQGQIDLAVRTSLHGQKESFAEGEGSEFHQLREYVPGDSLRRVDWKRSARQRRMLSKETRAERNHNIIIALDHGYLMREEIAGLPKIDHAINAALATAWAAAVGGDQVGLYTFHARPHSWMPPEAGRQIFPKLRRALAELSYESAESNPTLALATLQARLRRRSLVIVFSDFVDTTTSELMVEHLGRLSREHLVIFIALRDPVTEDQARQPVSTLQAAAEAVSASDLLRDRRIVIERLGQLGVMVLDVRPDQLTPRLVSTYLDLKAREVA
ncbi:DUF58 domain-containing protein [Maricaulis maris]|jgi:uncharacterized protein (DUF58 family)|uniref:DUF58 domain-containing protein n=1 Tax=Maricaulis maris TaxID=74318 RepID=UPI0026EA1AD5|nr:DUF58 domain-containing protein [Maricaulis maris]